MAGRRCGVCGSAHASCGGPSRVVAVDDRMVAAMRHEPLARYEVTVNGYPTVVKVRPSRVAAMYPGARPLDKAMPPPSVPEVAAPTPEPAPAGAGAVRPLGGGWYQLSNGERVRGLDAARAAQAELG